MGQTIIATDGNPSIGFIFAYGFYRVAITITRDRRHFVRFSTSGDLELSPFEPEFGTLVTSQETFKPILFFWFFFCFFFITSMCGTDEQTHRWMSKMHNWFGLV